MSVFHEVKLEHACDAANELDEHAESRVDIPELRNDLSKAWEIATDLPLEDADECIERLHLSNDLLTKSLNRAKRNDGKERRTLIKAIYAAVQANIDLIKELKGA